MEEMKRVQELKDYNKKQEQIVINKKRVWDWVVREVGTKKVEADRDFNSVYTFRMFGSIILEEYGFDSGNLAGDIYRYIDWHSMLWDFIFEDHNCYELIYVEPSGKIYRVTDVGKENNGWMFRAFEWFKQCDIDCVYIAQFKTNEDNL